MIRAKLFLGVVLALRLTTATDEAASQQSAETRHGYVQCLAKKDPPPVPVFDHSCNPKPVGAVKCGEPVEAIGRDGPWLKIRSANGLEGYIGFTSVSQSKKKFLALDLPAPGGRKVADCIAFWQPQVRSGTDRPVARYWIEPEYSDEARHARIDGHVTMSLTVGTDGLAHDIVVTKPLGHGLDEKAVAAVQQWRFDPAVEDGKAIPATITIEVSFHIEVPTSR